MSRSLKDYIIIVLKGMAMGVADTVPGVSGGTIAFISGIYQELINTISGIDIGLLKIYKEKGFYAFWNALNGNFLLALTSGILISIFSFMRLANYLLEYEPILIWSFFFGLVLASIWYIVIQIKKWNIGVVIALLLGVTIAYLITHLPISSGRNSIFYLILSGSLAVCAMILPGISGAFILVLLGAYKDITEAVHNFDFKRIIAVALGAIIGLFTFSRILKWLFHKFPNITLAILTGFIIGSLNKIWPWKHPLEKLYIDDKEVIVKEVSVLPSNFDGNPQLLWAIILMLVGFFLLFFLEKLASKSH